MVRLVYCLVEDPDSGALIGSITNTYVYRGPGVLAPEVIPLLISIGLIETASERLRLITGGPQLIAN